MTAVRDIRANAGWPTTETGNAVSELQTIIDRWAAKARAKIASDADNVTDADVDALLTAVRDASGTAATVHGGQVRQRLLYLTSVSPFIGSELIAAALHEPVRGKCAQIDPTQPDVPYQCVHDAMCDGWQVLSLPQVSPEPKGDEARSVGYQFVLQKLEVFHEA